MEEAENFLEQGIVFKGLHNRNQKSDIRRMMFLSQLQLKEQQLKEFQNLPQHVAAQTDDTDVGNEAEENTSTMKAIDEAEVILINSETVQATTEAKETENMENMKEKP